MRSQRGFTLIEIMVVVIIVSLLLSFGYVGFGQILGRRNSEDMESLQYWLQSARDRAQLEGAVYGIEITDEGLEFLTYRQGLWLRVLDQQVWGGEEYQIGFEAANLEEQFDSSVNDLDALQPSLVFLPDGSQWPEGRIRVEHQEQTSWISVDEVGQFVWAD